eukprot:14162724-Heterocapsa_arctica.AAC.1
MEPPLGSSAPAAREARALPGRPSAGEEGTEWGCVTAPPVSQAIALAGSGLTGQKLAVRKDAPVALQYARGSMVAAATAVVTQETRDIAMA